MRASRLPGPTASRGCQATTPPPPAAARAGAPLPPPSHPAPPPPRPPPPPPRAGGHGPLPLQRGLNGGTDRPQRQGEVVPAAHQVGEYVAGDEGAERQESVIRAPQAAGIEQRDGGAGAPLHQRPHRRDPPLRHRGRD